MGIVKNVVKDVLDTVEDLFVALIGGIILVFMLGEWYAFTFQGQPELYYPLYAFVAVLLYKLAKDVVEKSRKKKKK